MIEGAPWRRWVFFYVPVTAFVVSLLFPFYWMVITTLRPDSELYRPWSAPITRRSGPPTRRLSISTTC